MTPYAMPTGHTALISVYKKEGCAEFAAELVRLGWNILASGGTARHLAEHGVPVRDVAELVGGSAILGHRVVTLSREIHAGLLARDCNEDRAELVRLNIPRIDLVAVNLYPLRDEIARAGSTRESVIDMTDIGGPALLRSAAKGRRIIVTGPEEYGRVVEWLRAGLPDRAQTLDAMAAKAESVCGLYALDSAEHAANGNDNIGKMPRRARRVAALRYGENPWQAQAEHYAAVNCRDPLALHEFRLAAGDPTGYNGLIDLDRLLQTATHIAAGFEANGRPVPNLAVAVKHGNPCGAAIAADGSEAVRRTVAGDPRAIFGGGVLTNFTLDAEQAQLLRHHLAGATPRPLDLVAAPMFSPAALEGLKRKKSWRALENENLFALGLDCLDRTTRFRPVRGGLLTQPNYTHVLDLRSPKTEVIGKRLSAEMEDWLILAWAVGATSNSNTVCLVKDGRLIGNGCGQQDRVTAARHAVEKARAAGHNPAGAVAYSDSFFPFTDGPLVLADAGVTAVLTCSGSVRDKDVFSSLERSKVTVYAIPNEIGRGFFGH